MVNIDSCTIYASNGSVLRNIGASLSRTLYDRPVTVLLHGELGAGKTTFVQGLAQGMGIPELVTSPTYALEQQYQGTEDPLLHLDLYRLSAADAQALVEGTEEHRGVRCMEWPERIDVAALRTSHRTIDITIAEHDSGRKIHVGFDDIPLPDDATIDAWQSDVLLPPHIIAHCNAVAAFAEECAKSIIDRGQLARPHALRAAGRVHDLLRFLDFRPGAHPPNIQPTREQQERWKEWAARFPDMHHEPACAVFLQKQGFAALARIVEPHGFAYAASQRRTIEQKLLYYADKRVQEDRVVTVKERFADLAQRYGNGTITPKAQSWLEEVLRTEKELFGEDIHHL